MSATDEAAVAGEQAAHDAAQAAETAELEREYDAAEHGQDVEKGQLFDGNVHTDPRLVLEHNGRRVSDIGLGFLGAIELGRNVVDDVEFFKDLHEGQPFELRALGTVSGTTYRFKATEKHGTQYVATRRLAIDTVETIEGVYTTRKPDAAAGELRDAIAEALDELDGVEGAAVEAAVATLRAAIGEEDPGPTEPELTEEESEQLRAAAQQLQDETAAAIGDVGAGEDD